MIERQSKQTPLLAGWVIAAGAAAVAAGVSMVVMELNFRQATFIGAILFVVVGLILGLPSRPRAQPFGVSGVAPAAAAPKVHPAPQPAKVVEASPVVTAAPLSDAVDGGTKPSTLTAARNGQADDLKKIKGIGPKLEVMCNELGFWHFDQVAAWSPAEVAWVDQNLEGFKGRVTRDTWVEQAKLLAVGGETEFSARVDKGDVY